MTTPTAAGLLPSSEVPFVQLTLSVPEAKVILGLMLCGMAVTNPGVRGIREGNKEILILDEESYGMLVKAQAMIGGYNNVAEVKASNIFTFQQRFNAAISTTAAKYTRVLFDWLEQYGLQL